MECRFHQYQPICVCYRTMWWKLLSCVFQTMLPRSFCYLILFRDIAVSDSCLAVDKRACLPLRGTLFLYVLWCLFDTETTHVDCSSHEGSPSLQLFKNAFIILARDNVLDRGERFPSNSQISTSLSKSLHYKQSETLFQSKTSGSIVIAAPWNMIMTVIFGHISIKPEIVIFCFVANSTQLFWRQFCFPNCVLIVRCTYCQLGSLLCRVWRNVLIRLLTGSRYLWRCTVLEYFAPQVFLWVQFYTTL